MIFKTKQDDYVFVTNIIWWTMPILLIINILSTEDSVQMTREYTTLYEVVCTLVCEFIGSNIFQ